MTTNPLSAERLAAVLRQWQDAGWHEAAQAGLDLLTAYETVVRERDSARKSARKLADELTAEYALLMERAEKAEAALAECRGLVLAMRMKKHAADGGEG